MAKTPAEDLTGSPSWRPALYAGGAAAVLHVVLFAAWMIAYKGNITGLFLIGDQVISEAALQQIRPEPIVLKNSIGYDGQFYLLIAFAPFSPESFPATFTGDNIPYRYGRFVWPFLSWTSAWGNHTLVPWTMVIWNILLLAGAAALFARVVQQMGGSPWWGAVFALTAGPLIASSRMMNDAATVCAIMGTLLLYQNAQDPPPRIPSKNRSQRLAIVALYLLFAVAILARETSAIFLAAISVALFILPVHIRPFRVSRPVLFLLAALPFLPWIIWQGYLRWRIAGMEDTTPELASRVSLNFSLPLAGFISGASADWRALTAGDLNPGKIAALGHRLLYLFGGTLAFIAATRALFSKRLEYRHLAALALAALALMTSYEVWVEFWAYGHVFFLLAALVALEGFHRRNPIYLIPLVGDAAFSTLFIVREWWRVLQAMS